MLPIWLIFVVVIIGKCSNILKKKGFAEHPHINPLTCLWYTYFIGVILLTTYICFFKKDVVEQIQDMSWMDCKLFIMSAAVATLYGIVIMPLFKSMNYSNFSLIQAPMGMIVGIVASMLFLKEQLSVRTFIALAMYLGAGLIANQGG